MLELVKSNWHVATAVVALLSTIGVLLLKWTRYREMSMRLSDRKLKRLDKVLEGNLKDADPLKVQLALMQAFGRILTKEELEFARHQKDPLTFLLRRIKAGVNLRFKDKETGYESDTSVTQFDRRVKVSFWIAFPPFLASSLLFALPLLIPFYSAAAFLLWILCASFFILAITFVDPWNAAKLILMQQVPKRKASSKSAAPSKKGKSSAQDIEHLSVGTLVLAEEQAPKASNTSLKAVPGALTPSPSKSGVESRVSEDVSHPEISRTG